MNIAHRVEWEAPSSLHEMLKLLFRDCQFVVDIQGFDIFLTGYRLLNYLTREGMLMFELKLTLIDLWSSCRLPTSASRILHRTKAISYRYLAIAKIHFSRLINAFTST